MELKNIIKKPFLQWFFRKKYLIFVIGISCYSNNLFAQNKDSLREIFYRESGIRVPKTVSDEHLRTIYDESKKRNLPLKVVVRLIQKESRFDVKQKNNYMQLIPTTYNHYSKILKLKKNPTNNIIIGIYYFKEIYDFWDKFYKSETKTLEMSLASYKNGLTKMKRVKRIADNTTKEYVNYILN